MTERRLTHRQLAGYGLALMLVALAFDSPAAIGRGFAAILVSPSHLLTDYMAVGGIGAALFNAGLMTCLSVLLIRISGAPINGVLVAGVLTLTGFSLFGKNLLNSIPITLGVFVFTRFVRSRFREQLIVGLYGTALGPLVSAIAFRSGLHWTRALPLGFAVGILVGFLLPPLAAAFVRFHQGFNLYNVGFTAGMVGMVAVGIMGFLGLKVERLSLVYEGSSLGLAIVFVLLFAAMMGYGIWMNGGTLRGYAALLRSAGRLVSDYPSQFGHGLSLFNMGLVGLIGTAYALAIGQQLNGPIIAGILTLVGFGAYGKHPRNVLPILAGVLLINVFTPLDHRSTGAILSGLFGTTLAPIAGQFGFIPGVIAGFIHMAIVLNVAVLHSGVNLYNNGFSGGFVAAFMVPWLEQLQRRGLLNRPGSLTTRVRDWRRRRTQRRLGAIVDRSRVKRQESSTQEERIHDQ